MRVLVEVLTCLLCFSLPPNIVSAAGIDDTFKKPGVDNFANAFKNAFKSDEFGQSVALVVGIGTYHDYHHFPHLSAPPLDAAKVRDFLIKEQGFDYVVTLTEEKATRNRIAQLMESIFPKMLSKKDRFIFYFSGHGATRNIYEQSHGYLVLAPAEATRWDQMIPIDTVQAWSHNLFEVRHVLFIIDACYGGLIGVERKSAYSNDHNLDRLMKPAHYYVSAGDEEQQSFCLGESSLFTEAFLQAARSADFTEDGYITGGEILQHIYREIELKRHEQHLNINMTPRLREARVENNAGEFFFISRKFLDQVSNGSATAARQYNNANIETKGETNTSNLKDHFVVFMDNDILTKGLGDTQKIVQTPEGVPEAANRRVEIIVGSNSEIAGASP